MFPRMSQLEVKSGGPSSRPGTNMYLDTYKSDEAPGAGSPVHRYHVKRVYQLRFYPRFS